jgi:hypothetical protein
VRFYSTIKKTAGLVEDGNPDATSCDSKKDGGSPHVLGRIER